MTGKVPTMIYTPTVAKVTVNKFKFAHVFCDILNLAVEKPFENILFDCLHEEHL